VLNFAAEHDLARGHLGRARARASEALVAARTVERQNQVAIACATLARLEIRARERNSAHAHLDSLRVELEVPLALSAHARAVVERALRELDEPFAEAAPAQSARPSSTRST
jgi:hypothetical protein